LLLLDEPAGGLDAVARREFLETSIQLSNREGTAIFFSSHHMTDVERIGGRVILLDEGRVRLDRDLDRIREDICLAVVPRASAPDAAAIERTSGCLRHAGSKTTTAKRFSCVLGMLSSLEVKVLRPT
jgi:ABC-type multidrug transport system ATPase subunit